MLKFHTNPMSSNAQKVRLFLEETNIPFEAKTVDLRKGQQSTAEYRAINPFETVPAIELGSYRMSESNAILRFLAKRYDKSSWYPNNLEDQARVDQMMDFCSIHVSRFVSMLNWNLVIAPMIGRPTNPALIEEAHAQLRLQLPRFERYLSTTTSYLCGSQPTIADVSFAPLAAQAKRLNVPLSDFPSTSSYINRLLARPAWVKVEAEMMKLFAGK